MIKDTYNEYNDTFTPVCDGCGAELPEEWEFLDAVNAMKANGWRMEPPAEIFDSWTHLCPACAGRCDFE